MITDIELAKIYCKRRGYSDYEKLGTHTQEQILEGVTAVREAIAKAYPPPDVSEVNKLLMLSLAEFRCVKGSSLDLSHKLIDLISNTWKGPELSSEDEQMKKDVKWNRDTQNAIGSTMRILNTGLTSLEDSATKVVKERDDLKKRLEEEKAGHPGEHPLTDEPLDRQIILLNRQLAEQYKKIEKYEKEDHSWRKDVDRQNKTINNLTSEIENIRVNEVADADRIKRLLQQNAMLKKENESLTLLADNMADTANKVKKDLEDTIKRFNEVLLSQSSFVEQVSALTEERDNLNKQVGLLLKQAHAPKEEKIRRRAALKEIERIDGNWKDRLEYEDGTKPTQMTVLPGWLDQTCRIKTMDDTGRVFTHSNENGAHCVKSRNLFIVVPKPEMETRFIAIEVGNTNSLATTLAFRSREECRDVAETWHDETNIVSVQIPKSN